MHRTLLVILLDVLFLCVGLAMFFGSTASIDGAQPISVQKGTNIAEISIESAFRPTSPEAPTESREDDSALIVIRSDTSPAPEQLEASPNNEETPDRDYLVETATPGATMTRQGPELAIGRLHPEFVRRLAGAIREAREAGFAFAGIFSAYRPPAFGVGGFSDKFNSLHTYGLAVDMTGIGGPGSEQAKMWHEIAARHGVECPYGFANRVEWNHCQPTRIKIIKPENPLRETVTADGPINLQTMFEAGTSYIKKGTGPGDIILSDVLDFARSPYGDRTNERFNEHTTSVSRVRWTPELIKLDHLLKAESLILGRFGPPAWCSHLHRPPKGVCGGSHEISIKTQNGHPRQASATPGGEGGKL